MICCSSTELTLSHVDVLPAVSKCERPTHEQSALHTANWSLYDSDTGSYDHAQRYFVCLLRCTSMRMSTRSKFSLVSQKTLHITALLQKPSGTAEAE